MPPQEALRSVQSGVLDTLSNEIGNWAKDKGFREDWEMADVLGKVGVQIANTDIGEVIMQDDRTGETTTLAAFMVRASDSFKVNIIGMKLMLTTSELAEALETLRDHGTDILNGRAGNFGEETADAHIRLLELEDMVGASPGQEVTTKVQKNRDRPHKHGRQV